MSLDMCAWISKQCVNKNTLKGFLSDFFLPSDEIITKELENAVSYEHIYGDDKVIVYFSNEKRPPYNIYDSNVLGGEFEYEQLIVFDISKEAATTTIYKEIVDFCINLRERVNSDILVTSDAHGEVCLLKEQTVIWSRDISWSL